MSDFIELFSELFPVHSELQKTNNPLRKVLDNTIGEYMDNTDDILDELSLTTATGGWLDAFGKDYGVVRNIDEEDEAYRQRIIFEKLEYLTATNLQELYNISLYSYVNDFDVEDNTLVSDNPYLARRYMSYADTTLQEILNNKFVLGDSIEWL